MTNYYLGSSGERIYRVDHTLSPPYYPPKCSESRAESVPLVRIVYIAQVWHRPKTLCLFIHYNIFILYIYRLCRERLLLWFYLAELTQREILSIFRGNKGVRGCDPPYIICTSNNKRSYTFDRSVTNNQNPVDGKMNIRI